MLFNQMFFCAVALMFTALLRTGQTACQLTSGTLYCSNMAESQFMDETKQFINSNFGSLNLENVNTSKLPIFEKWVSIVSHIYIQRNKESMSAESFQNYKNLAHLTISYSNVPPVFNGLYVSSKRSGLDLYFENNNITEINSLCQGDYPASWDLQLEYNNIKSFDKGDVGTSQCVTKLRYLKLDYNQITLLNVEVFSKLSGLRKVFISYNNISSIQNDLRDTSTVINVERLELSYNKLEHLKANSFNLFNKLRILDLSHNRLGFINHLMFSNLPALSELHLHGNRLVRLVLHLSQPPALTWISLSENLWECDALTPLVSYLVDKKVTYYRETNSDTDMLNIGGINCIRSASLKQILQLNKNITQLKAQQEQKINDQISIQIYNSTKQAEDLYNATKQITELKLNLKEQESILKNNSIKQAENLYNATKKITELKHSLKEHALIQQLNSKQIGLFIIMLAVLVVFIIALSAVVVWSAAMHRRYSKNIGKNEAAERSVEVEQSPGRQKEPLYDCPELPGAGRTSSSGIYEEPPNFQSSAPIEGQVGYAAKSGVVTLSISADLSSTPVYDTLAEQPLYCTIET